MDAKHAHFYLVQKYLKPESERHNVPLPWYPMNDRQGTTTIDYARLLLDALAGDERRKDIRKLYRLFQTHRRIGGHWKNPSYHMLVEACWEHHRTLPFWLLHANLKTPTTTYG